MQSVCSETVRGEEQTPKTKSARGCEACWEQDRGDAVGWAAGFVWGAAVLLAEATGYSARFAWWDGWDVFFAGAGLLTLIQAAVRLTLPAQRHLVVKYLVFGAVLLAVGIGDRLDWTWIWPLALVAVAVIILQRTLTKPSNEQRHG